MLRTIGNIVAIWFLALFMTACTSTLGDVLAKYGYREIRPPSNLMAPGTIVTVDQHDPFVGGIVCVSEASLGPTLPISKSNSSQSELAEKTSAQFNIGVDYLNVLKAKAGYSSLKSVKLNLSNVMVLELSDSSVFDNVPHRTEGCEQAMEFRRKLKAEVSVVKAVLAADVLYSIEFSAGSDLNFDAIGLVKGLAPELGANVETATATTLRGQGLFWGIRDDVQLARINKDKKYELSSYKLERTDLKEALEQEVQRKGLLTSVGDPYKAVRILPNENIATFTVNGQVLYIKDRFYTLKDDSGQELRLRIDSSTKVVIFLI